MLRKSAMRLGIELFPSTLPFSHRSLESCSKWSFEFKHCCDQRMTGRKRKKADRRGLVIAA